MATSIMTLLAFLLPLIIQRLQAAANERKGGNNDANIQAYRKALVKNDSRMLGLLDADQHDRVRALCGGKR